MMIEEHEQIKEALNYFTICIQNNLDSLFSVQNNYHPQKKQYFCFHCNIKFRVLRDLRKHERDIHKIYICEYAYCELKFPTYFEFVKHKMDYHFNNKKNIKKKILLNQEEFFKKRN